MIMLILMTQVGEEEEDKKEPLLEFSTCNLCDVRFTNKMEYTLHTTSDHGMMGHVRAEFLKTSLGAVLLQDEQNQLYVKNRSVMMVMRMVIMVMMVMRMMRMVMLMIMYVKNRSDSGTDTTFWRCRSTRRTGCRGRAITVAKDGVEYVKTTSGHNHAGSVTDIR